MQVAQAEPPAAPEEKPEDTRESQIQAQAERISDPVDREEFVQTQRINDAYKTAWGELNDTVSAKYYTPEGYRVFNGKAYSPPPPLQLTGDPKVNVQLRAQHQAQVTWFNEMARIVDERYGKELQLEKDGLDKKFDVYRDQLKSHLTELRGQATETRKHTYESHHMKPEELYKHFYSAEGIKPGAYISQADSDPGVVVRKEDGSIDENKTQLNFVTKLDKISGGRGLEHLNTLGTALYNTQQFNPQIGTEELAHLIHGMGTAKYTSTITKGEDGKPKIIDYDGVRMYEVNIYADEGARARGEDPFYVLNMPEHDAKAVAGVYRDFHTHLTAQRQQELMQSAGEGEQQRHPGPEARTEGVQLEPPM